MRVRESRAAENVGEDGLPRDEAVELLQEKEQRKHAMESRPVIDMDMARGVLMAGFACEPGEAWKIGPRGAMERERVLSGDLEVWRAAFWAAARGSWRTFRFRCTGRPPLPVRRNGSVTMSVLLGVGS